MIMDDYDQVRYRGVLKIAATRLFFGVLRQGLLRICVGVDESIGVLRLPKILESRAHVNYCEYHLYGIWYIRKYVVRVRSHKNTHTH
jgi:hypothetical protein